MFTGFHIGHFHLKGSPSLKKLTISPGLTFLKLLPLFFSISLVPTFRCLMISVQSTRIKGGKGATSFGWTTPGRVKQNFLGNFTLVQVGAQAGWQNASLLFATITALSQRGFQPSFTLSWQHLGPKTPPGVISFHPCGVWDPFVRHHPTVFTLTKGPPLGSPLGHFHLWHRSLHGVSTSGPYTSPLGAKSSPLFLDPPPLWLQGPPAGRPAYTQATGLWPQPRGAAPPKVGLPRGDCSHYTHSRAARHQHPAACLSPKPFGERPHLRSPVAMYPLSPPGSIFWPPARWHTTAAERR